MSYKIFGKDLKPKSGIKYALMSSVYGVGAHQASRICDSLGLVYHQKVNTLSEENLIEIQKTITKLGIIVEGELRTQKRKHIEGMAKIRCYKYLCRERGVPANGQRSRSNGNTAHRMRIKST